jgi:hypothetical protein
VEKRCARSKVRGEESTDYIGLNEVCHACGISYLAKRHKCVVTPQNKVDILGNKVDILGNGTHESCASYLSRVGCPRFQVGYRESM